MDHTKSSLKDVFEAAMPKRGKAGIVARMMSVIVSMGLATERDAKAVESIMVSSNSPRAMRPGSRLVGVRVKGARRHAKPKVRTMHWWAQHPKAREAGSGRPLVFGWGQNRSLNRQRARGAA